MHGSNLVPGDWLDDAGAFMGMLAHIAGPWAGACQRDVKDRKFSRGRESITGLMMPVNGWSAAAKNPSIPGRVTPTKPSDCRLR